MFKADRILIGIDFTRASHEMVKVLYDLEVDKRCSIVLVHVVPDLVKQSALYVKKGDKIDEQQRIEQEAVKMLDEFRSKRLKGFGKVEAVIVKGDPAAGLLTVASTRRVNLIILGVSGSDKIETSRLGSTADKVIRGTPCPVLFVPLAGT